MKKVLIFLFVIMVLVVAGFYVYKGFAREDSPVVYKDLIYISSPKAEGKISSPLTIKGEARGMWFFEATFPVVLVDWDGRIIAEGYATAQKDPDAEDGAGWMTEDFVPFEATIEFDKPEYGERGAIILQKSNPSGLPQYDDALEQTIYFK